MPEISSVPEEEDDDEQQQHQQQQRQDQEQSQEEEEQTPVRASGSNMICDLAPGIVFANIPIPDTMRGETGLSTAESRNVGGV